MIRFDRISKSFDGRVALSEVSFEIGAGELLGLVGADGAGKSTLIRILLGSLRADAGSVSGDLDSIGYVSERFSLYTDLSIWENMALMGALCGVSADDIERSGQQLLELVGLERFADRLTGRLSGGMKQKAALATALLHEPKVLVLDEPTTGVDPVSRREFWRILHRVHGRGMTVLLATPYGDEAAYCQRVGVLHEGRLLEMLYPDVVRHLSGGMTAAVQDAVERYDG